MPFGKPRITSFSLLALAVAGPALANVATPTIVEAENATLGTSLASAVDGEITYVAASENFTGNVPASQNTIASFSVTFPEAGQYELFARIYIGPQGASDDSLIFATRFGAAAPGLANDWSVANNLTNVGFAGADETILSTGAAGGQLWKWIRVSSFASVGVFTVPENALTQEYRISSREDGLRLDKIAFGQIGVAFTVDQLNKGLAGTDTRPPPGGEPFQATGPIIAHQKSKFLGSVWSSTSSNNKDFEFYWNGMWHGNAGKWESVEGVRDSMNWTVVDQGYQFAKSRGVKFNFHVLLWGSQQPSWISQLEPAEQLEEIKEWMQAVADRYPDIDYLQVVNEPINAAPNGEKSPHSDSIRANYGRALGGEGETGFDWILEGFRLARHYFPNTPLMINEYGIEGNTAITDQYLAIIQALQAEDLIDLVGFQGHAFNTKVSSAAAMQAALDKIGATGLPIMITEMEIDGFDDFVQLEEYKRVFPIYWDHPSVIGINISGHIGNWRADQGAVLVNEDFSERLALKWIREYVSTSPWNNLSGYLAARELDETVHAAGADFDGDGLPTGLEYLLDSDPEDYSGGRFIWSDLGDEIDVRLTISATIFDGTVYVERSDDLANWEPVASYDINLRAADGFTVSTEGSQKTIAYSGTSSAPAFYRIAFSPAD